MQPIGPKIVTIFGGTGFIGRLVVQRLAQQGYQIRVATRKPASVMALKTAGDVGQISAFLWSPRDDASTNAALAGADYAINLVGILFEKRHQKFAAVHAQWPARFAHIAAAQNVQHIVHVSALGANETSQSVYARSKKQGEDAVRAAFKTATILRPSVVFGDGDGFFNLFARLAQFLPVLPLIGGGHTQFQPVYVGDVADAIMAALGTPAARGKIYELGGPQIYTFRALLNYMRSQTKQKFCLVSLPWAVARVQAWFFEFLPYPLLTRDQVILLQTDNVMAPKALGLRDLGIAPTALEAIAPLYLKRYQAGGRFAK